MPAIDLRPSDWGELNRVLKKVLSGVTVWAFGSRVNGTAKPYSDLDLAIVTDQALSFERLAVIKEAFDESDLSIRVDVVDWAATSAHFQQIILRDKVSLQ